MQHENLHRGNELKTGSNRSFGLIVGGILAAIGGVRAYLEGSVGVVEIVLWGIGAPLILLAVAAPGLLTQLNRAWMMLGLFLSKIVTPVIMGLVFFLTVTPTALVMRLLGKDLLGKRFDPAAGSYWVERKPPGPAPDSMKNQF